MPFDNDRLVHDNSAAAGSMRDHELTLRALEAVSGGKPARKPPPPPTYLTYELKDVVVSSF